MESSILHRKESIFIDGNQDTVMNDSMEKEILIVLMIINDASGQESAR